MKIIGIDTATATASVALVEDGKVQMEEIRRSQLRNNGPSAPAGRANHAEIILPLLQALLRNARLSLAEISGFAISIGPGSFTGLRIGLSTVKGLSFGWGISVVGISTLWGYAARVTDWDGLICPFLDARKKEVYAAIFQRKGELLERISDDVVTPPDGIIRQIQRTECESRCLFIGDGVETYGDSILRLLGERGSITLGDNYRSTASAIALLGEGRFRQRDVESPAQLVPVYLRSSEAESKRGR